MTFGQPRIGNAAFASYFKTHLPHAIRVTHAHDIVPHLPPYFSFFPEKTYHHFPREVWYALYSTITIPFLQIAGAPGFYASLDSNTSFFSFLQVWIHNIGLGSLVYNVEKICDDSGEDPTCSRSSISLKWKNTADSRCIFIISFPLHFQLFGVFHTHLYSGR